jgi:hypothetical protein
MPTTIRLVLRQHRWSIGFTVAAAVAITTAALYAWSILAGLTAPAHCIEDRFLVPMPPECAGMEEALQTSEEVGGKVMASMAVLPLLAGILVGAPLVGSEIETRTATIAWSLGPSRRHWLVSRLAILVVGLAAVLAVPAVAADLLSGVRPPHYDPATTTTVDYGLRGPLVVLRGLAAFAIGTVVGLVVGRVLPALLVGGVAVILMWNVLGTWMYADWPPAEDVACRPDQYCLEYGPPVYADAAGTRHSYEDLVAIAPMDPTKGDDGTEFDRWLRDNYTEVNLAIPGERLGFLAVREGAALGLLTVVVLGGSVVAVEWRRPV